MIWLEGEAFQVPRPQNTFKGNQLYNERAPVFISAGDKLRISPQEAFLMQVDPTQQNEMMDARFTFFKFPTAIPNGTVCQPCGKCFADWLGS